ncbi:hypothetical protein MMC27_007619 [Xylographa pallens]|nr:hypothetical protein [Xylographa pallens]
MELPTIHERIKAIQDCMNVLVDEAKQDEDARKELLDVAMKSVASLETPAETILRIMHSPVVPSVLTAVIKMGALQAIVKSETPMTVMQLATITGADELLIVRLMRPLVALRFFLETDVETYASTPISQMLTAPHFLGGFQFLSAGATKSLAYLPDYLAMTGYRSVNSVPGPFEFHMKVHEDREQSMFEWLISDPPMFANWNAFMSGRRAHRKQWYEMYPADQIILEGVGNDDDAILLVDVGGGEGQDAEAFRAEFSDVPGRVILQDLPKVIKNIEKLDVRVVRMGYNFFRPQPVKGARAYYFRNIFHNWSDVDCLKILENTASAMKKGHSKLLMFEWILPEKDVPLFPALLDINLMALLSGMERTEAQWRMLLDSAGFEIVKFWKTTPDTEGMIEAVLKGDSEEDKEGVIEAEPKRRNLTELIDLFDDLLGFFDNEEFKECTIEAMAIGKNGKDMKGMVEALPLGKTETETEGMIEAVPKENENDTELMPEAVLKEENEKLVEL